MSDGVLAAIIAACATVFASFMQLRSSFAKEVGTRPLTSSSRRKSRLPMVVIAVMLGGAAVGGFALSQWLTEHERVVQNELQRALQERIATMTRTESALEQTVAGTRTQIEESVLREMGMKGVAVTATVAPCKPPLVLNTPALAAGAGEAPAPIPAQSGTPTAPASTCTEADASPITLCATVPANANVTEVEVYVRAAGADTPWNNARVTAGQEFEQARFGEKPLEVADEASMKQVCESFAQWSTERARVARMLVRYSF